jgi:hypothetical protein
MKNHSVTINIFIDCELKNIACYATGVSDHNAKYVWWTRDCYIAQVNGV